MLKRPPSRSLMIAFSIAAVLILLLGACGAPAPGSTPAGNVFKGGTWTDDLFEEPNSLIPNGSSETFAVMVDQAIYAPLFYGDSQGAFIPAWRLGYRQLPMVTLAPILKPGNSTCAQALSGPMASHWMPGT